MAEYGRIWQIAVDCCRLRQSRDQSLIAKSVETGGRVTWASSVPPDENFDPRLQGFNLESYYIEFN